MTQKFDKEELRHNCKPNYKVFSYLWFLLALLICSSQIAFGATYSSLPSGNPMDSLPLDLPAGLCTPPKIYAAPQTAQEMTINGDLNEPAWQRAPWSTLFSDIAGVSDLKGARIDRPDQILPTRIKMCWDNHYLYIAATLKEPNLWATLKQRDNIIYHNNDFEVFFTTGPDVSSYYELELNQLGTLLDLFMTRPYRNGGKAMINWDLKGIKTAVKLQGSLNDPRDIDSSWTLEMAIPYSGVLAFSQNKPVIGDYWRINFSRVEWDLAPATKDFQRLTKNGRLAPEHNWVWSPQGIINMHAPDRWGYLFFVADSSTKVALPFIELQKAVLWKIYYAQQIAFAHHQKYALTLESLGLPDNQVVLINPVGGKKETFILKMAAGAHWFRISLCSLKEGKEVIALDQNGLINAFR